MTAAALHDLSDREDRPSGKQPAKAAGLFLSGRACSDVPPPAGTDNGRPTPLSIVLFFLHAIFGLENVGLPEECFFVDLSPGPSRQIAALRAALSRHPRRYHIRRAQGRRPPACQRPLAAHLRISQITVETAYGQLAAEGYIHAVPRSGYFVQQLDALPRAVPPAPPAAAPAAAHEPQPRFDFKTIRRGHRLLPLFHLGQAVRVQS